MDCPWSANATRKMRVVPVLPNPSAKHLPGTIPVVSVVPAVPVAGASPAKRLAPALATGTAPTLATGIVRLMPHVVYFGAT